MGSFYCAVKKEFEAEASILATCFNLTRMVNLLGGVAGFIAAIQAI